MESLISSGEPIAGKIHESIDKRAWWGMLILPCVGLDVLILLYKGTFLSLGSIGWAILFLDPLRKIFSLLDAFDQGYLNSNKFSDEINACFDDNAGMTTKVEIKEHADTLNNVRAFQGLIITVISLTILTTIAGTQV